MKRTYTMQQFFNHDAYVELVSKLTEENIPDAKQLAMTVKFLTESMESFHEYVHTVDATENAINIAYATRDGDDLIDYIQRMDKNRTTAHENAIARARAVNRMAAKHQCESLFKGNVDDRYQVADFCLDVCIRVFGETEE